MDARHSLIEAYFKHLESKLETIRAISEISEEEALMLCCCHLEALGARQYQEVEYTDPPRKAILNYSKSAAFTKVLAEHSRYSFWDKIHPIGLLSYLPKLFDPDMQDYMIALGEIGYELREEDFVIKAVSHLFRNSKQREWFENHCHKGSLGNIAYSKVRSEIVHNITHQPISFDAKWQGERLPDIEYSLMIECLENVISSLKASSLETRRFWWEQ